MTKKEFELFASPAPADVFGSVLDFLGMAPVPGAAQAREAVARPDMGKPLPLMNQQVWVM